MLVLISQQKLQGCDAPLMRNQYGGSSSLESSSIFHPDYSSISLEVWESVSADDRLGGNSSDGAHGQASVHEFGLLLLLHGSRVRWGEKSLSVVTSFTFSVHGGNSGRGGDDHIEKTDPQKKLVHGSTVQKSIVGINSLGDALERVHFSWDAEEVRGNETDDGNHGSASVTKFTLTEPWKEGRVGLGKLQL
mmetsp:Transcript_32179/g.78187  ORF Transcript_32179/g.78187 Transcript_32179/m.78187 type:complete len:191 (-) Transcript_32179:368-940(-)